MKLRGQRVVLAAGVLAAALGLGAGWWLTRSRESLSVLHHFTLDSDGAFPSTLILANDGALYGATWVGSVAFRVTTNGDFSVIARFRSGICSAMVEARDGNLYALIAPEDSPFLALCRLVPDGEGTVLHRFAYGELLPPLARLMTSRDGQVYGLTRDTVYRLTSDDQLATVHQFAADQDRSRPRWGLTQHSDNAWYGVTEYGGEWGLGTVFRITPEGAYGLVCAFTERDPMRHPIGPLVEGSQGDLFGVARDGDRRQPRTTVFKVSTNGSLTAVYTFRPGAWVRELSRGADGAFYGTGSAGARPTSRIGRWIESVPDWLGRQGSSALWRVTETGEATLVRRIPDGVVVVNDGVCYGAVMRGGAHPWLGIHLPLDPSKVNRQNPNPTFQVAQRMLRAVSIDVDGLNRDWPVHISAYSPEGAGGRQFVPLYWVRWLRGDIEEGSTVAIVELVLPTEELRQLRVGDARYILRPRLEGTNVGALLTPPRERQHAGH